MRSLSCLLLALALSPSAPQTPDDSCTGCVGAGGTASSSGGTCGGTVSITVQVEPGDCRWVSEGEELLYECVQTKGCKTTVTRSWSGLPSGSDVDFCIVSGGEKLCLKPRTPSGSSSNGQPRSGPTLACSDAPGSGLTFTVESGACGLSAEVYATCSACEGDL